MTVIAENQSYRLYVNKNVNRCYQGVLRALPYEKMLFGKLPLTKLKWEQKVLYRQLMLPKCVK